METLQADQGPTFSITAAEVPPEFYGLPSYSDPLAASPRVDRRSALQVPAVKRGRDLIAGTLGTLPVEMFGPGGTTNAALAGLLNQPEAGTPRSVTMARTYEDLLFEGVGWWLVTEVGWHGYPTKVKRLDPRSVDVKQDGKVYVTKLGHHGQSVEYTDDFDLIRFDSPNEPLLVAGARAIRTCLALDAAANRYANGNQPLDYFTPSDGVDPDQADLDAAMDAWDEARKLRATGYVPATLTYNTAGWNPEQLQMAEARQHAVLELSRVMGVPAEHLGVSTTSRTYFNAQNQRKDLLDFTMLGYSKAVEERLSMNDVTPRGYAARTNYSEFMRTDDLTRVQVATQAVTGQLISSDEGRAYFDPSLPISLHTEEVPTNV